MLRCGLLIIPLLMSLGCGSDQIPTYPVTGRVEFTDGTPVRHGTIELESADHELSAAGKIQHDGSFVLGTYTPDDGAVAGEHKAIVVQMVIADGSFEHTVDHGKPVPVRYAAYETSSLTARVEAVESNEIVLQLTP